MTPVELVKRAASQPIVKLARVVNVPGPELSALLSSRQPLLVSDLMAHPDQKKEIRKFQYGHILDAGISIAEIQEWETQHPHHDLPPDVVEFLQQVNGVHLWADIDSHRSYYGILPVSKWQDANDADWNQMFVQPSEGLLVISYHDNGDYFLVLDAKASAYFWYDLQDFDNPLRVGNSVPQLLDWWWEHASELDPRQE